MAEIWSEKTQTRYSPSDGTGLDVERDLRKDAKLVFMRCRVECQSGLKRM